MKKCTSTSFLYIWPEIPETSWQDLDDIVAKLTPPVIQNEREQFAFNDIELKDLKQKYTLK